MTHVLQFIGDYGSGWLWPGDDVARAAFGLGPLEAQALPRLSADTCALADHLLERSAQSLNHDYPPDGCLWPSDARLAFDLAADGLLARMRGELGAGFELHDGHRRLAP